MNAPKRIAILANNAPPALCGVTDYGFLLMQALAHAGFQTEMLTLKAPGNEPQPEKHVLPLLQDYRLTHVEENVEAVLARGPSAVVVQFGIYGQGRWGIAPGYIAFLRRLARACPLILTAHEPYADFGLPLRKNLYSLVHRCEFLALTRAAAAVVITTRERWQTLQRWPFCLGDRAHFLPVPSNIAFNPSRPTERYGLESGVPVVGLFSLGGLLDPVLEGLRLLRPSRPFQLLLLGGMAREGTKRYQRTLKRLEELDLLAVTRRTGPLPAARLSQALQLLDVSIVVEPTGYLTKSGTTMALLSHGVPVVAYLRNPGRYPELASALWTLARRTPESIAEQVGQVLANPEKARARAGLGRQWYAREASWETVSARYRDLLHDLLSTRPAVRARGDGHPHDAGQALRARNVN